MAKRQKKGSDVVLTTEALNLIDELSGNAIQSNINTDLDSPAWVGFYHPSSPKASEVQMDVPGITEGSPIIQHDDEYIEARGVQFQLLKEHQYFAIRSRKKDEGFCILEAREDEPETREERDAPKIEEVQSGWQTEIICLGLAFVPGFEIPIPWVSTFKGVKSPWVKKVVRALEKTTTTRWQTKSALNTQLAKVKLRNRVTFSFKMIQRPNYILADCAVRATPVEIMMGLKEATESFEFDRALQTAVDSFPFRVEKVRNHIAYKGEIPATGRKAWK
jgi:hypothetical protein